MIYPFGKAPAVIASAAIVAAALGAFVNRAYVVGSDDRTVLTLATFNTYNLEAYEKVIPEFEREHGVRVRAQFIHYRALNRSFRAALLSGSPTPDLVEISKETMGGSAGGPVEQVPLADLTELLEADGLRESFIAHRLDMWSYRGRVIALPHDVHPIGLLYRRDLIEAWGIDVSRIKTWDDFVEIGRKITRDADGDGVIDHYALEMEASNYRILTTLLLQAGVTNFDKQGNVNFYQAKAVDIIHWYVLQYKGAQRIGYSPGQGTRLIKAMNEGLVVFWFILDQRTGIFERQLPQLEGKLAMMPLPAWDPGGKRSTTYHGTGLCITNWAEKTGKKEIAWELAKRLYANEENLERIFETTNVIPPLPHMWDNPIFHEPDPFFSGQRLGRFFIELVDDAQPDYLTPYWSLANEKLIGVLHDALSYYSEHGEDGLRAHIDRELRKSRDYIANVMERDELLERGSD